MSSLKYLLVCLFLFLKTADIIADCTLSLQKDFGNPSPVYLKNNKYLSPQPHDIITLKQKQNILVACPGNGNHIILANNTEKNNRKFDLLKATCIEGTKFSLGTWEGQFINVTCKTQAWTTVEETTTPCTYGGKIFRVGHNIHNTFYALYEACFDKNSAKTLYVKHELRPFKNSQTFRRPSFQESGVFNKIPMSKLYSAQHQKDIFETMLGPEQSQQYITKKQFLSRGHLAPRADFPFRAEMRATFQYLNSAPQWQSTNSGDWAALEEAVRRRGHATGRPLTILTGAHGILQIPDNERHMHSLYMYLDENNNPLVPVPMYFYKVVYDEIDKRATAFVSINAFFYNETTTNELQFCSDICYSNSQFSWLKWRNDGAHSFCCDYEDFKRHIQIPNLDVVGRYF